MDPPYPNGPLQIHMPISFHFRSVQLIGLVSNSTDGLFALSETQLCEQEASGNLNLFTVFLDC